MRKRINSKDSSSSRPSGDGQKTFRRSSTTKSRPEGESRFSKPSIKKSSLRAASSAPGSSDKPRSFRPRAFDKDGGSREFTPNDRSGRESFDKPGHDRPRQDSSERPRFDRPRFDKPGIGKPRSSDRNQDSREFKPRESRDGGSGRSAGYDKPGLDKPRFDKPAGERDRSRSYDRPREDREFKPRGEFNPRERREGSDRPSSDRPRFDKPAGERSGSDRSRSFDRPREDREFKPRGEFNSGERSREGGFDKPRGERTGFTKPSGDRPSFDKPRSSGRDGDARSFKPKSDRPFGERGRSERPEFKKKDETLGYDEEIGQEKPSDEGANRRVGKFETAPNYSLKSYEKRTSAKKPKDENPEMRLNRYIANAGICSRREADDLIASGQISVNGKTVTEMGHKVLITDVVKYGKKALNPEKMVYVLINKPKDYITTTDDPEERKTVLDLIKGACNERIYPVGRLDRNTTGLLLMTNDGELAGKLTHPSSGIKKIYQAELDKPITTEDFEKLKAGLELEDGFIRPDEVGIVTPDAMVIGLEIHSGRNRIVRRMFEHLGYEVQKLDRTVFAGLNKKDLPRGKWRFLGEKEVIKLKYML